MVPDTGIQHRLYLKQMEFMKQPDFGEVLPANFNYQNLIMVSSDTIEKDGQRIVFQTYSCGCGPQPLIRSAFLLEEVKWQDSKFRMLLVHSENKKDTALIDQTIFPIVYRIRRIRKAEEKRMIEKALQDHFGDKKKINFF
jgi:hypothetical protein